MSNKIPKELYQTVYEFYDKQLAKGTYISKIADIFNKHFGTQYAESSLRNRYEYQRDLNNVDKDILDRMAEVEKAEHKIALQEMDIISKRKRLQRQQSAIDSQLRYNADKELVAEVFNQQERTEYEPIDLEILETKDSANCPIYNLSDLHLGYLEENYYNLQQAKDNLTNFFKYVNKEIQDNNLKEIVLSETGDSIEGSTLRATQLFTIAKVMTEQATIYIDLFTNLLKQLAEDNKDTLIRVMFVDEDNHSQIRVNGANRGDTTEQMSKVIANDIRRTIEAIQSYGGLKNVIFKHGSEIITEINGATVLLTHGHQYSKDNKAMLKKIHAIHNIIPDVVIRGHFHSYSHFAHNVVDDFMQVVITAPSLVGNTRYGRELLGLTGLSGVMKIVINEHTAVSEFVKI